MNESESESVPTTDPAFSGLIDALVELIRSGVRPDVLEAQRVLLERLATQGDVFPARVPAPKNITEVGGYLNLLEQAGFNDLRSSAISSALGIAGPARAGEVLAGVVPIGFVNLANDRPPGPAQASIPPFLPVRADFHGPLLAALNGLHAAGCMLPLRAPRATLPASLPGAGPTSPDMALVFATLGRSLEVFPGTVLIDPAVDPLAIARPEAPATDPVRLVARELDGGTTVPEASWIATRVSQTAAVEDAPALRRYLDVAPLLAEVGWIHPTPTVLPVSTASKGTLVSFINLTGLVPGESTLGEELSLLYPPAEVARSALALFGGHRWDGTQFLPPG